MSTFLDRLKIIIGEEKPFSWAKRIGLPAATFNRMWNEGTPPKWNHLTLISEQADVTIDWLLTGEGPMRRSEALRLSAKEEVLRGKGEGKIAAGPAPVLAGHPKDLVEDIRVSELVAKTIDVLQSDTIYRASLAANINSFHLAISMEQRLEEERAARREMEQRMAENSAKMEARLAEMEKHLQEERSARKAIEARLGRAEEKAGKEEELEKNANVR
jgi:hypothetical protein